MNKYKYIKMILSLKNLHENLATRKSKSLSDR